MKANIGVQNNGSSPVHIKAMAMAAMNRVKADGDLTTVADIGGGKGDYSLMLAELVSNVCLVDYSPPLEGILP